MDDLDQRIDSLGSYIERVRQEMSARQALHQITLPATRLQDTQSTVSLEDIPSRPRALTMDASCTGGSETLRDKLEKMRARRRHQHQHQQQRQETPNKRTVSAATTAVHIDSDDEEEDFFESSRVAHLFEEIEVPARDLVWDKRVFYYHASEDKDEDWCIRDCRQECLELLGNPIDDNMPEEEEEEEEEGGEGEEDENEEENWADRSYDWTKDGFGYMEFRRLSSSNAISPVVKRQSMALSRIMESDDPVDWEMVETPRGLKQVMDENKQLEWEIKRTRVAVAALTRLAIK